MSTTDSTCILSSLPNELLEQTFYYLTNIKDRLQMAALFRDDVDCYDAQRIFNLLMRNSKFAYTFNQLSFTSQLNKSLEKLRGVAHLDLRFVTVSLDDMSFLEGIETISLYGCHSVTDDGLKYLCGVSMANIGFCSKITDTGIAWLHGIQRLSISHCPRITDAGLKTLGTNLQSLNVDGCPKITDAGIEYLATNMTCLESISVQDCSRITTSALTQLTNLRSLAIGTQDNGLERILGELPKLTALSLNNYTGNDVSFFDTAQSLESLQFEMQRADLYDLRKLRDVRVKTINSTFRANTLDYLLFKKNLSCCDYLNIWFGETNVYRSELPQKKEGTNNSDSIVTIDLDTLIKCEGVCCYCPSVPNEWKFRLYKMEEGKDAEDEYSLSQLQSHSHYVHVAGFCDSKDYLETLLNALSKLCEEEKGVANVYWIGIFPYKFLQIAFGKDRLPWFLAWDNRPGLFGYPIGFK